MHVTVNVVLSFLHKYIHAEKDLGFKRGERIFKKKSFWPKFLRSRQNFEKIGQYGVFKHFKHKNTPNCVFLARAPSSKLLYIGAITKNGYLKIVQRGDHLGRQGAESL